MNKDDLKDGRIVKFRGGNFGLVLNGGIYFHSEGQEDWKFGLVIEDYKDDLTLGLLPEYSIEAIYESLLDIFDEDSMKLVCGRNKIEYIDELEVGDIIVNEHNPSVQVITAKNNDVIYFTGVINFMAVLRIANEHRRLNELFTTHKIYRQFIDLSDFDFDFDDVQHIVYENVDGMDD